IIELADYLDEANNMPRHFNEAQAEAMVTIAFNSGADALDFTPEKRQQLIDKLIFQLRMVSRGAYYLYRREQECKLNKDK
ncbi:MAG: DNA-binding transcriptional regulator FabR, partial [Candidatus Schmidhempelia sp.]|nr:DNA-binding transcriptional regulator FabR [Candidatus Schmidhempelia sp.]